MEDQVKRRLKEDAVFWVVTFALDFHGGVSSRWNDNHMLPETDTRHKRLTFLKQRAAASICIALYKCISLRISKLVR